MSAIIIDTQDDEAMAQATIEQRQEDAAERIAVDSMNAGAQQGTDFNAETQQREAMEQQAEREQQRAQKQEAKRAQGRDTDSQIGEHSREQLAEMLNTAQAHLQRQREEALSIRATMERVAKSAPPKPAAKPISDEDFYARPVESMRRAIDEHPAVTQAKQVVAQHQREQVQRTMSANEAQFLKEFPDAATTMADPKFREWVAKSPVRMRLAQVADQRYDVAAARELFGNWKDLTGGRRPAQPAHGKGQRGQGSADTRIFKRSEILKLMETDRERYEQLAPAIERAYRENRIR